MDKRKLSAVVLVSIVIVAALGAIIFYPKSSSTPENELTNVRYAAPLTIAAAPVYVADAKGFWNEEGLDVDVTYFDSGRKALDALLANDAEVMSVSETPPLRSYLSGSNINIVATVTKHKEAKMTVRSDRISVPSDVKGKKIGTVAGTNSDYYMYRWLEANNIQPNEVEIIPLDATALAQAFVQGNVDVMFAWEPHNFNASSKISSMAKSWPTDLYEGRHSVVMNTEYYNKNMGTSEKMIKGFVKAQEFIQSNPDEAKKIVLDRTGMSAQALNGLWKEYGYEVGLDNDFASILEGQSDWINANQAKSAKDPLKLIDSRALMNVDSTKVDKTFKR